MNSPAPDDEPGITLTAEAVDYARRKRLQQEQPQAALRVGVRGGGCAGLTYVTELTDEPARERDLVYDYGDIQVFVDRRSLKYLAGSTLRYERTLMYQGFKWDNPQQESSCGCGTTFSIKKPGSASSAESSQVKPDAGARRELKTI